MILHEWIPVVILFFLVGGCLGFILGYIVGFGSDDRK